MTTINKKTKISKANKKTESYRTTIPKQVVEILGLNLYDEIEWVITIDKKPTVEIKKKVEKNDKSKNTK